MLHKRLVAGLYALIKLFSNLVACPLNFYATINYGIRMAKDINPARNNLDHDIEQAVAIIAQGGIVAFPTETYYGLAVNPFNHHALERLFSIKQRPISKPILTLVSNLEQLTDLTDYIPDLFKSLMDKFWPGPLTLVFGAKPTLPDLLTANTGTVGSRISSHPVAQEFVKSAGMAVTATSANISGKLPAVSADEVMDMFGPRLDWLIDGGVTPGGAGSTIVGHDQDGLKLIREGVFAFAKIRKMGL